MKLKRQVCSRGPSEKLRELGVKQESYFYWEIGKGETNVAAYYFPQLPVSEFYVSAFTVAELGEMLPEYIKTEKWGIINIRITHVLNWHVSYYSGDEKILVTGDFTEADARAKMLVYLLENKLITI